MEKEMTTSYLKVIESDEGDFPVGFTTYDFLWENGGAFNVCQHSWIPFQGIDHHWGYIVDGDKFYCKCSDVIFQLVSAPEVIPPLPKDKFTQGELDLIKNALYYDMSRAWELYSSTKSEFSKEKAQKIEKLLLELREYEQV